MADRSLRGTRLGALSMESDVNVVPSARQITVYVCPQGHRSELPCSFFSPTRSGPASARLLNGESVPDAKPARPPRTHWDMLLERRSIPELEELLAERLALLRASRGETSKRSA